MYWLLSLQGAEGSTIPQDQEWLDHLNHILQQKVRFTNIGKNITRRIKDSYV